MKTEGPTCAQAVALLVVRDAGGDVFWTDALPSARVMGLNEAATPAAMSAALAEWAGLPARHAQTTADLSPWSKTSGQPGESEFPFHPEAWMGEEAFARIAAEAAPMFCYVQGMESLSCLIERDGRLEKIGVQSFPG
ncbi:MAG: hypothetical protein ABL957_14505 [Parvularculaceae bacterium]